MAHTPKSSDELKVDDILRRLAQLWADKNLEYGGNYEMYPRVMQAIFPEGVKVETHEEHLRMQIFSLMVVKFTRYACNWEKGHPDSLDDLAVYAALLRKIDSEVLNVNQSTPSSPSSDQ